MYYLIPDMYLKSVVRCSFDFQLKHDNYSSAEIQVSDLGIVSIIVFESDYSIENSESHNQP